MTQVNTMDMSLIDIVSHPKQINLLTTSHHNYNSVSSEASEAIHLVRR